MTRSILIAARRCLSPLSVLEVLGRTCPLISPLMMSCLVHSVRHSLWSNVPPVILSNIAQQPPTEARPLEDSSVHVVLAVSRLYWDLLLPLTAAWYGKTVLNQRDETLEMDFIKYFEGANILKCSSTLNSHIGNIMAGLECSQILFLLEQPRAVTLPSGGDS